jgi:hypothetical protein
MLVQSVIIVVSPFLVSLIEFGNADAQQFSLSNTTSKGQKRKRQSSLTEYIEQEP